MPIVTDVIAYPYGDIIGPTVGTSLQVNTGSVVTEFSTGRVRKRLNGYGVNYVLNLRWTFSPKEHDIFMAWWGTTLINGSAKFMLANLGLSGPQLGLWTGIFTSDPQVTSLDGGNVTVTASASFEEVPVDSWESFLTKLNPKWQEYFASLPEAINHYYNGRWDNVVQYG